MKVLIVCSGNFDYTYDNFKRFQPFVYEQIKSLEKLNIKFEIFLIKGKGTIGYLKNLKFLNQKIKSYNPDIIHAHYGLSGLLAVLQRKVPVIVTFHGCDIQNKGINNILSNIVHLLANYSIFVNEKMLKYVYFKKEYSVVSCGIDKDDYKGIPKLEARKKLKYETNEKLVLFSSNFNNPVKNYTLAKKAINLFDNVKLIELNNFNRNQVINLMYSVDCLLVTSVKETGPQVVKEALMCGCPIVSTDVGDVKKLIESIEGCYIVPYDEKIIYEKIKLIFQRNKRINGIEVLQKNELFNSLIAEKIKYIYINKIK